MSLAEQIDQNNIPSHVAIIMDGNGRWAKKQGKARVFGHKHGVNSVRTAIDAAAEIGVKALTIYAFSTENWNRPKTEVKTLMTLLLTSLKKEAKELIKNNIKLQIIGNRELLPDNVCKGLSKVEEETKNNDALTLTVALSYGSREEMVAAFKRIYNQIENNELAIDSISEETINQNLYTNNLPDVDLLIRTSGEQRISNFLLWQIAYAELHFTNVMWPDFSKEDFFEAVLCYQNRERRFGKTTEQIVTH